LEIIAGRYKGRPLIAPKNDHVRPTLSSLREAVFNMLQGYMEEALFLDLFAGSGAMGLEALSRGAAHASFVDVDRKSIQAIKINCQALNVQPSTTIYFGDVLKKLGQLQKEQESFDIIYADPPYDQGHGEAVLSFLDSSSLLNPEGFLFIEEGFKTTISDENLAHLKLHKEKRFGSSKLFLFTTK
jgi:16S rRNA (guanine966-N2)-methyltransferase